MISAEPLQSFEDYSFTLRKSFSNGYRCYILEYTDCLNKSVIVEGSFDRLLSKIGDKDFALLCVSDKISKPANILRNRKIRSILNNRNLGIYHLIGHWEDIPDKKYDTPNIINRINRAYLIVRPNEIPLEKFENILVNLLDIDENNQNYKIILKKENILNLIDSTGTKIILNNNIDIYSINRAYSKYLINQSSPKSVFRFDGVESPDSILGYMIYAKNLIYYCK